MKKRIPACAGLTRKGRETQMPIKHEPVSARSWLFAPGDSEKKMTKAMEGEADIVLIDLEDAVAPDNKANARPMVHDFIKAHLEQRHRLWVRINPFDGPYTLADLAAKIGRAHV